jgi:hypothetical protein
MNKIKVTILISLLLFLTSFGQAMQAGVFKDPAGRFEVAPPPSNAVIKKNPAGISFSVNTEFYGEETYNVNVYEVPPELPKESFTLEKALEGVEILIQNSGMDIKTSLKEKKIINGREILDYNFELIPKDPNFTHRSYISRFIKTEKYIYWLSHSILVDVSFNEKSRQDEFASDFQAFLEAVKLKGEF